MMAFARGDKLSIYVPLRSGGLAQRSTGTASKAVVREIERTIQKLKDARRWKLLEAVTSRPPQAMTCGLAQSARSLPKNFVNPSRHYTEEPQRTSG